MGKEESVIVSIILIIFLLLLMPRYWYISLPILVMLLAYKANNKKNNKNLLEEKKSKEEDEIGIKLDSATDWLKKIEGTQKCKAKEVLTLKHVVTEEDIDYEFPSINFLKKEGNSSEKDRKKIIESANKLENTLRSFNVSAKVESVSVGPVITRYEIKLAEGIRINQVTNLEEDIALSLAVKDITVERIPGKQLLGIEVLNKDREIVLLKDIIDSDEFRQQETKLIFALGKTQEGEVIVTDIDKMPHLLIAGSTGTGKSICINTLVTSIIYKAKPSEVKLVMIDPRKVELPAYNGIPHLIIPVVTDARKATRSISLGCTGNVKPIYIVF